MRRRWYWIAPLAIIGIPHFLFVGGEGVMHLWNWLLHPLLGWRTVGFWQASGMLALCRTLFGGIGGHNGHHDRHGWKGRCKRMTPEERQKFRQAMQQGFEFGPSAGQGAAR